MQTKKALLEYSSMLVWFSHRVRLFSDALLAVFGLVLLSSDALAWGPAAHVDISLRLLQGAAALTPAVIGLIRRFSADFIYGSLAADSVVGKNLADAKNHCHSWRVARALLIEARNRSKRSEAFMLGYLSHLAADVVAHNHFVPERLVTHFGARNAGHFYWEARFDRRVICLWPQSKNTLVETSTMGFGEHDAFLAKRIQPTVFSNAISRQIYKGTLGIQRNTPWQKALAKIDKRSKLLLTNKDTENWQTASIAIAALVLNDPFSNSLDALDPTGKDIIKNAALYRRVLRRNHRSSDAGGRC